MKIREFWLDIRFKAIFITKNKKQRDLMKLGFSEFKKMIIYEN